MIDGAVQWAADREAARSARWVDGQWSALVLARLGEEDAIRLGAVVELGEHGRVAESDGTDRTRRLAGLGDEALIDRVAHADHEAFRILVERHLERVHRIAWRMLADHGEAEEVAQEAMLRLWTQAARFDPERGARLATWLHRIVLNLCLDRRRRRRPQNPVEAATELADTAPHPLVRIAEVETAQRVAEALDALPERQRMAVVLCYYERRSNSEAAAVLGIGVGALESLLVRARRALRKRLTERS